MENDRKIPISCSFVSQSKCRNAYMKCALDFPGKKANLRLAHLNILGGCAMLGLCTVRTWRWFDVVRE